MPKRLLIVDDEEATLRALEAYFTQDGFEVDRATEVEEAKALLSHRSYSAVLCDLRLTHAHGAEGLDLLSHVRERRPGCPLVLLSAFAYEDVEREAVRRGAAAVLHKPIPLRQLSRRLNLLIEGKRGTS